ncbi:hypothetical protein MF271_00725 (plasmid) [Deinococcus sp. KNUC1210]|uniref:hypothetical protein n=1 Tax=Deinococcus sp. KNUC1210 TaxID=2917691 RepID=UPI001EEF8EBB|nr:hypothetical protein [Deinococcus sp. KNUC1210]ULH14036.1 hypothetical protein MF271_00725 [Deinococcus sp. KNUC1210]
MKNIALLATVLTAGLSWAGAQTWDTQYGTYTLKGCYPSASMIRCDFSFVLTAENTLNLQPNTGRYEVVAADGKTYEATKVSAGGSPMTNAINLNFYKGVAVPISVIFAAPSSTRTFSVIAMEGVPMNNIQVRGSTPTPVVTTPPTATAPAGVPTGFSLRLSNCKVANGTYTCTATLTPAR